VNAQPLREGFRDLPARVHDLDEKRHQAIVEIPHRSWDAYHSDFDTDCFRESFARQLPEMKREHRDRIGESLRAEVLPHANRLVTQFDDSPIGERSFRDIRDGRLKGWSFHYRNGKFVQHPDHPEGVRYMKADMAEVSAVARPAIPNTRTVGIRSQPDPLTYLEEVRARMGRRTGQRSQPGEIVLSPYDEPELFLLWVAERAERRLSEITESRYERYELMRDGLAPPTPQFRLQQLFVKHPPKGPRRCL
jgi:hypothetical protein